MSFVLLSSYYSHFQNGIKVINGMKEKVRGNEKVRSERRWLFRRVEFQIKQKEREMEEGTNCQTQRHGLFQRSASLGLTF